MQGTRGSGAPSQYPHHTGLSDMGHVAGVGITTKDSTTPGFHSPSVCYNSTLGFETWDTSRNTAQADFGIEFASTYEAYNAEKQHHQSEQAMLLRALEGFTEISSQQQHHYYFQTRPPQRSQDALELICSTPGIVMGAYGAHSPPDQHVGAYPAADGGLQHPGMFVTSNGSGDSSGLTTHYDAPRLSITVPDPELNYGEFDFLN